MKVAISYNLIGCFLGKNTMTNVSIKVCREKICLRGYVDGVRRLYTTKYKNTEKDLAYVEKHKDKLFREKAYAKDTTLKTYAKKVCENTVAYRCDRWNQQVEKYVGMIIEHFQEKDIAEISVSDVTEFQAKLIALNYSKKKY